MYILWMWYIHNGFMFIALMDIIQQYFHVQGWSDHVLSEHVCVVSGRHVGDVTYCTSSYMDIICVTRTEVPFHYFVQFRRWVYFKEKYGFALCGSILSRFEGFSLLLHSCILLYLPVPPIFSLSSLFLQVP